MITKKEATEFIRQHAEVVLDTSYGEIHICGKPEIYKKLIEEGKKAFSPAEIVILSEALEKVGKRQLLDDTIRLKISEPAANLDDIRTRNGRIIEVVLKNSAGALHACMDTEIYKERVEEKKAGLSPQEIRTLLSAAGLSSLKALTTVKAAFLGSKLTEINCHAAKPAT